MAFLLINGQELPSPKRGVNITVSTVVNAGRNAKGEVIGQRIGRDLYKIDGLEWPWLTASEWSKILSLLSGFFVNVTFNDPVTNERKTVQMYPGDRHATPYWIGENGKITHYKDCKVNLIDRGG